MENAPLNPYQDDEKRSGSIKDIDFMDGGYNSRVDKILHRAFRHHGLNYVGDLEKLRYTRQVNKTNVYAPDPNTGEMVRMEGVSSMMAMSINNQMKKRGLGQLKELEKELAPQKPMKGYAAEDFYIANIDTNDQGVAVELTVPQEVQELIQGGHIHLTDTDPETGEFQGIDHEFFSYTHADRIAPSKNGVFLFFEKGRQGLQQTIGNGLFQNFANAVNNVLPRAVERQQAAAPKIEQKP